VQRGADARAVVPDALGDQEAVARLAHGGGIAGELVGSADVDGAVGVPELGGGAAGAVAVEVGVGGMSGGGAADGHGAGGVRMPASMLDATGTTGSVSAPGARLRFREAPVSTGASFVLTCAAVGAAIVAAVLALDVVATCGEVARAALASPDGDGVASAGVAEAGATGAALAGAAGKKRARPHGDEGHAAEERRHRHHRDDPNPPRRRIAVREPVRRNPRRRGLGVAERPQRFPSGSDHRRDGAPRAGEVRREARDPGQRRGAPVRGKLRQSARQLADAGEAQVHLLMQAAVDHLRQPGGTSGRASRSGGGACIMIAVHTCGSVSPRNGGAPARSS
jgi:hypothetical protein